MAFEMGPSGARTLPVKDRAGVRGRRPLGC
jgi:hypothetical protein